MIGVRFYGQRDSGNGCPDIRTQSLGTVGGLAQGPSRYSGWYRRRHDDAASFQGFTPWLPDQSEDVVLVGVELDPERNHLVTEIRQ